ncbi:MAG: hypothetical protein HKP30_12915 [Myxococcales bacterium]|nr:hypothetical protein [Myxococcales bacterium]
MSAPARPDGGLAAAFAEMPLTLKGVTSFFAVFGVGSVLLPLLPGIEHRVGGARLASAALWQSGFGVYALAMGLWLSLCAFGLLRRAGWACWGAIGACLPFLLAEPLLAETPRVALRAAIAVAWGAAAWAYLFRTRGATAYFRRPAPR